MLIFMQIYYEFVKIERNNGVIFVKIERNNGAIFVKIERNELLRIILALSYFVTDNAQG